MESKTSKKRECKFYDSFPNNRIRERMGHIGLKSNNLSDKINEFLPVDKKITAEAVRQWGSGYTRPDLSIITVVADALECTIDYLMGRDSLPTREQTDIFEQVGLSSKSIDALKKMMSFKLHYDQSIVALNAILESDRGDDFLLDLFFYIYGNYTWVALSGTNSVINELSEASCETNAADFQFRLLDETSATEERFSGQSFIQMVKNSKLASIQEHLSAIRDESLKRRSVYGEH